MVSGLVFQSKRNIKWKSSQFLPVQTKCYSTEEKNEIEIMHDYFGIDPLVCAEVLNCRKEREVPVTISNPECLSHPENEESPCKWGELDRKQNNKEPKCVRFRYKQNRTIFYLAGFHVSCPLYGI